MTGTAGCVDMNDPATLRSLIPRFIRSACSRSAAAVTEWLVDEAVAAPPFGMASNVSAAASERAALR